MKGGKRMTKKIEKLMDEWEEKNINCYTPNGFCEARQKYEDYLIKEEREMDIVV